MLSPVTETSPNAALREMLKLKPEQVEMFREVTSVELVSAPSFENLILFVKAAATLSPEQATAFSKILME